MSENTPIVRGTPTLRARVRRTLGGAICSHLGHRPCLSITHYNVRTGEPPVQLGVARILGDGRTVPIYGYPSEQESGREVRCRRCWALCGDSLVEDR